MTADQAIGLLPILIGALLFGLARPLATGMVRYAEWQVSIMRKPGFVWYYRSFGIVFLVVGIAVFFSPAQH